MTPMTQVGAIAQTTIAAADAACTFCCCWLLSDRWPYSFSTGTVLSVNLMLAAASLWLADRIERSDRRDYARATAGVAAATEGTEAHARAPQRAARGDEALAAPREGGGAVRGGSSAAEEGSTCGPQAAALNEEMGAGRLLVLRGSWHAALVWAIGAMRSYASRWVITRNRIPKQRVDRGLLYVLSRWLAPS